MRTTEETREVPIVGAVVTAAGLALMAVLSWRAAGHLPDPVVLAGAGKGGMDQHAPKVLVLGGMPLLTVATALVMLFAQRWREGIAARLGIAPWRDDRTHRKSVDLALGVLIPVLLSLHLLMLRAAEGQLGSALGWAAAAVALVVIIVGNVWPKQVPAVPDFIGARLGDRARRRVDTALEAQRRRLRPTGVVMLILGLVALACSWPAPAVSLAVSLSAVLVMAAVPLWTAWRSVTAH